MPFHVQPCLHQTTQQILCATFGKKFMHALRHHLAKAVNGGDLFGFCLADRLHGAEMLGQQSRRLIANVANAKAEQQLVQIVGAGFFNSVQKIFCAFRLEFIQREQLLFGEGINICCRGYVIFFYQLAGHCLSQAFDVHCIAAGKVNDVSQALCRALGVYAAQSRFTLQAHHRLTARRANAGHLIGLGARAMCSDRNHLGDNIARLAHTNGIADMHIQLADHILVVQACARHAGARQQNRLKHCRGSQHAGAPHRNLDCFQLRIFFLGRILKCDGPAGIFVGAAHLLALAQIVHFDHRAVDIKRQAAANAADLLNFLNGSLDPMVQVITRRNWKAQRFDIIQCFVVRSKLHAAHLLQIEHKNRKPTRGCNAGILLAQRTCRCVSRVFKGRFIFKFLFLAQLFKSLVRHIHFTAHFQIFRRVFELCRNIPNGCDILGNILAHHTVAPGRGTHQLAVFIFKTAGKAVDLSLHHIVWLHTGLLHTAVKIPQFFQRKCIQQAFHFNGMGHFAEFSRCRAAHMLGGRIGGDQLRKFFFDLF